MVTGNITAFSRLLPVGYTELDKLNKQTHSTKLTQWVQENYGICNPLVVIKYIYLLCNYFPVHRLDYFLFSTAFVAAVSRSSVSGDTEKRLQTEATRSILFCSSTDHTAMEYIFQVERG